MQPQAPSHKRPAALKAFHYGAPYYPEHWDEATRAKDAERMAEAGFNLVRMAEFAWDRMEPREGEFDFSFFDRVIEHLGRHGIRTLMCTPTATPPRWLTLKHPEVMRVEGWAFAPAEHGSRQHACYAVPVFREYSRTITKAMADHYRGNPNVTGWQTDNEMNCAQPECHCAACRAAFPEFLRTRYGNDIGALNAAWGTAFWAQTYARFEDIPTPRDGRPSPLNPGHWLDYCRYISHAVTEFQRQQVEILRAADPEWFLIHNGLFPHIDYRGAFTRDLDVLGYDSYPNFDPDPDNRPSSHAFNLDRARCWSGNFFIPEQQSGPGGQKPYLLDTAEPGEMRKLAYASIAHGADALMFFRWRTARFGAEEYWCGILDHDNIPRRRYREAAQLGRELKAAGPEILGTHIHAECAVAAADMDVNDGNGALPFGLPSPDHMAEAVHGVLHRAGLSPACVHPSDDLSDLKLYVIPHWTLFRPEWVPNLEAFVRAGGTMVVGARTATRDWHNRVVPETAPGCLAALCGVTVEEFGKQNRPDKKPLKIALDGTEVATSQWYEQLEARGAEVLGRWKGRHLEGSAAVTMRPLGKGRAIYVGTYLTADFFAALLPKLRALSGLAPLWDAPAGVEVVQRRAKDKKLWFFLNGGAEPKTLASTPRGRDLLTGAAAGGAWELGPYGVAVIKEAIQ